MDDEKKFHGISPHSRKSAKTWRPLGSPTGGWIRRRPPKTRLRMTTLDNGFSSDHVHPSTERL
jgi:hypothetical protein